MDIMSKNLTIIALALHTLIGASFAQDEISLGGGGGASRPDYPRRR